jgi:transcriptional regulator with XRE-family HTH domain
MIIGQMLQAYRQQRKLSLRTLAKRIGCDFTSISMFERGKRQAGPTWVKIMVWSLTTEEEPISRKHSNIKTKNTE